MYRAEDFYYHKELKGQYERLRDEIIQFMENGKFEMAVQSCEQYDDAAIMDSDLSVLKKLISVCRAEKQLYGCCQTWKKGEDYRTAYERYYRMKFLLWDAERGRNKGKERLIELLRQNAYSMPLAVVSGIHNAFHLEELLVAFAEGIRIKRSLEELAYLEFIAHQVLSSESIPFDEIREEICQSISEKVEIEIAELEEMWQDIARLHREELPRYWEYINQLLKSGDWKKLSELLSSKEFYHKFKTVTDMVYMILVNQIYQEEIEEHAERTILDGRESIEELMAFIREMKFKIWRFEFETEETAGAQLLDFIHENHISGCMMKYAVYMAGMDKVNLLVHLAVLFLDHDMLGKAFAMLKYADELSPGSEEILCTMADLCLKMGKKEEAMYCLARVKRPTQITITLRKLCEA